MKIIPKISQPSSSPDIDDAAGQLPERFGETPGRSWRGFIGLEGRHDINEDEDEEGEMVISPTIFLAMVIGMVIGKQWMVKMILQSKAQG